MKKAIFLNAAAGIVERVYAKKHLDRIARYADLDKKIYTGAEDLSIADVKDVEYVFSTWGMPRLTEEEIREHLPSLKAVFYAAGSVQSFARPFLNCGVRVFSGWRGNGTAVAQFTFAQILLAAKGFLRVRQAMDEEGRDASRRMFSNYPGAYDIKVGLLGCGAIGGQIAEMLKMTDCEVWVFDPFLPDERAQKLGVKKTGMLDIFKNCTVISNHLANLPTTQGIIKRECFMSMQPYSTFINTGRGAQLNEQDLYDALVEDKTRTALLDVMIDEQDSDDKELAHLPNCFVTPHMSGSSGQEVQRMADRIIEALEAVETGEASPAEVFMKMLETMA
ncbi:MAG: hypothetical protein IJE08_05910 [Clostridia bacterium]|nr:hypothetical protein [Clostridia bacterium]